MRYDIEEKGGAFSDVRAGGEKRRKAAQRLVESQGELQAAQDPTGLFLGLLPAAGEAIGNFVAPGVGGQVGKAIGTGVAEIGMAAETRPERKKQYREQMDMTGKVASGVAGLFGKGEKGKLNNV